MPHVVIGGVAVSIVGEPRVTLDLDVLALVEQERWGSLVEAGAIHGLHPRISDAIEFAARSRVLLMLHRPSGVPVDLTLGTLPFERDAISHATVIDLRGIQVPVARVEDLIVMKAVAHREIDLSDVGRLLLNPDLDLISTRERIAEFASILDAPEILDDFDRAARRVRESKP
ncbi:MAG: hypothetical protein HW416_575 [Chloroflexi bacterium]|nr:hypothetical protein [Chloroflexota bacterium]